MTSHQKTILYSNRREGGQSRFFFIFHTIFLRVLNTHTMSEYELPPDALETGSGRMSLSFPVLKQNPENAIKRAGVGRNGAKSQSLENTEKPLTSANEVSGLLSCGSRI